MATKETKQASPGYSFILVMTSEDGIRKQRCERHGQARLAAHRHLLKNLNNEASIITLWTPHTMGYDSNGGLEMRIGKTEVKGMAIVTRADAETERLQAIDNSLRNTQVMSYKGSITVKDDGYELVSHNQSQQPWMKGTSEGYNPWKKARTPQGLPIGKAPGVRTVRRSGFPRA